MVAKGTELNTPDTLLDTFKEKGVKLDLSQAREVFQKAKDYITKKGSQVKAAADRMAGASPAQQARSRSEVETTYNAPRQKVDRSYGD